MIGVHRFLLSVIALFAFVATTSAAGPADLRLFRPDSLAGWDYGDAPSSGWTVAEGRVQATPGAAALRSGFSFGDFALRWQWRAADKAALKLLLPESPRGPGLQVVLAEDDRCGQLTDAGKSLAPGRRPAPLADANALHSAELRRADGKLALTIDGQPAFAVEIGPQRRFGLGLAAEGQATLADLRLGEPAGQPIGNGRNLAGWWTPGNLKAWTVEQGEIVLTPGGGNYLRSEKTFGNFTLALEYKMQKGGNSGFGIRTPRNGWPSGDGMELQLWDRPASEKLNKHSTMAIYGNVPPLARNDKSEDWNALVVKADGYMISAWINGELVQQVNTWDHPELRRRNLEGWIGIQDHNAWVRVRNLRVLEAPLGKGLDAWYARPPRVGGAALIERLMNPRCLAQADGIRSGVAAAAFREKTPGDHVLAELTGPGAVVWIARNGNDGRLAFFFDGESQPRLECAPNELRQALPEVAEDGNPVTTCLLYQRSLKIVLRNAKQATYRIEHVQFPPGTPVASFAGLDRTGLPRGWLEAADYRNGQCHWGVHREHDALPRADAPPKPIAPGRREELLRLEGAGVVEWLKLRADKKALDNNDLWIEATVDGEPQPALSAPARMLFPGLAGQGNYRNFLMTDRGGPTLLLAMPYGRGLTLAVRNAGKAKLGGVGLSVAYEPAAGAEAAASVGLLRLRSVFHPAGSGAGEWLNIGGGGRWVGWVYAPPPDASGAKPPARKPAPTAVLELDGQPADGWTKLSLEGLLGQSGKFRSSQSGRSDGLAWRYFQSAPVDFRQSLVLKAADGELGDRLGLYYATVQE